MLAQSVHVISAGIQGMKSAADASDGMNDIAGTDTLCGFDVAGPFGKTERSSIGCRNQRA
jgi:hypothetical protein